MFSPRILVLYLLLILSALCIGLPARDRAGSSALTWLAPLPVHAAAAQSPQDFGCPAGKPASPSPGPAFVPSQDCEGWVPPNHPLARHPGAAPPGPPPSPSPSAPPAGADGCPPGLPPSPRPSPGFVP